MARRKIITIGTQVASRRKSEKVKLAAIPKKASCFTVTPLIIWGKIKSRPNPTIEEVATISPMATVLPKVSSKKLGTQKDKIASDKKTKKRVRAKVKTFDHKGSFNKLMNRLGSIYFNVNTSEPGKKILDFTNPVIYHSQNGRRTGDCRPRKPRRNPKRKS